MYLFVKVRIDVNKLPELGQKLQSGELDMSKVKLTYCLQDDVEVGFNIWEVKDMEEFNQIFASHKKYYKEVLDVTPVIMPDEAQKILMQKLQ